MSDVYLPIEHDGQDFFVMVDEKDEKDEKVKKVKKSLSNQILIYKKDKNGRYSPQGSSSQNLTYEDKFETDTYFVNEKDKNYLIGGNKTTRRQYRYHYSSKKRVASQRRGRGRGRGRGRQTRYSRRK